MVALGFSVVWLAFQVSLLIAALGRHAYSWNWLAEKFTCLAELYQF